MKNEVLKVLKYFRIFNYLPTFKEIYKFLPLKVSKTALKKTLIDLESKKKIKKINTRYLILNNKNKNTGGEYFKKIQNSKFKIQNYNLRLKISKKKLNNWRFKFYIKLLSLFPQIKLIGLSGSVAMMNARKNDDIDLFIITAKNRLFTGRFLAIILAKLLGIHRKREKKIKNTYSKFQVPSYPNKVCLNLFFDESNLEVPDFKKTEYVAHEILQMKPIIIKNNIYHRFLTSNRWVFKLFPNAKILNSKFKIKSSKLQFKIKNFDFFIVILKFTFYILHFFTEKIEKILKKIQFYLINRHKTTELITDTQLWFHPEDFGKKIKY